MRAPDVHQFDNRGDVRPPKIAHEAIRAVLEGQYRIDGRLTPLAAERDQMFRVDADDGRCFVLRISSEHELPETLELQRCVLDIVASHAPALPVPRLVQSISGRRTSYLDKGGVRHAVRVFKYLQGVPIGTTVPSAAQRHALGAALAELDLALANVSFPSDGNAYLWDLQRASSLRSLIAFNKDPARRRLCVSVLDEFEDLHHPRLQTVRRQFIHNDANPKNILVDPSRPDRITGIIDFGDMVRSALVAEVSVAIARQVTTKDPMQEATELVSAYHQKLPLTCDELDLIYGLACIRLFMRIAIWTWRGAMGDARSKVSNLDESVEVLDAFRTAGPVHVGTAMRRACGLQDKKD